MSRSQLDPAEIAAVRDQLPAFDCLWAGDKVPRRGGRRMASAGAGVPPGTLLRRGRLGRLARACVFPGIELRLVNLSSSGALFESRARFTPDRPIRLVFVTAEGETAVDGIVSRSSLHAIAAQEGVLPERCALRDLRRDRQDRAMTAGEARWVELMQRSFGFDVLACPRCGDRLERVALIEDPSVIWRILRHLGLPTDVPAARPARPPPLPMGRPDGWNDDELAAP